MFIGKCKICHRVVVNCYISHSDIHPEWKGSSSREIWIELYYNEEVGNMILGMN